MSDMGFKFIKPVVGALILISALLIAIVSTEKKISNHYEKYPCISEFDSLKGSITSIFNDWSSMNVRSSSRTISVVINGKNMSIYASSDGTWEGMGIAEIAGVGDWVFKKSQNDTVWIKKRNRDDMFFVKLIK